MMQSVALRTRTLFIIHSRLITNNILQIENDSNPMTGAIFFQGLIAVDYLTIISDMYSTNGGKITRNVDLIFGSKYPDSAHSGFDSDGNRGEGSSDKNGTSSKGTDRPSRF